jgi:hypothetical protein
MTIHEYLHVHGVDGNVATVVEYLSLKRHDDMY